MSDATILYYTCNRHLPRIDEYCRAQLAKAPLPVVSVSLNQSIEFGDTRIVLGGNRSAETMHKQILRGLREIPRGSVFLCESDVLYHPSHFEFFSSLNYLFYYNTNVWRLRLEDGLAVRTDNLTQVSSLCADRDLLFDFYSLRVEQIERQGFNRHYEPGLKQTVGGSLVSLRASEFPNICIRHDQNLTKSKWSPEEFRNSIYAAGWQETYDIPGWGETKEILRGMR